MKNKLVLQLSVVSLILMLASSSCAPAAFPSTRAENIGMEGAIPSAPEYELPSMEKASPVEDYSQSGSLGDQGGERLVIKNADLTLVVADPSQSMSTIAKMAEDMGGFVVSANMYQEELESGLRVPHAQITIRVPAERLNEALDQIKKESEQEPLSETINSQDVTSEYTDLQSRLRNLELAEKQLAEIMEKAEKTEDVLAVYNQLVQVREQIEVIKGQIKYYEQSAALSSISVNLIADEAIQPLTIGRWQPQGVAKDALQALINGFKFIINALIWIVIFILPMALVAYAVFLLPVTFLWRTWRRRRAQKKVQVKEEKTAPSSENK